MLKFDISNKHFESLVGNISVEEVLHLSFTSLLSVCLLSARGESCKNLTTNLLVEGVVSQGPSRHQLQKYLKRHLEEGMSRFHVANLMQTLQFGKKGPRK